MIFLFDDSRTFFLNDAISSHVESRLFATRVPPPHHRGRERFIAVLTIVWVVVVVTVDVVSTSIVGASVMILLVMVFTRREDVLDGGER